MNSGPRSLVQTVLCVDDNEPGLGIRKVLLETIGFRVLLATSGRQALSILSTTRVNAVILDYHMPEMDGAELARRLKASCPDLPLIMLTGHPQDIPPATFKLLDAFIVKGERPEKLVNALCELTGWQPRKPMRSAEEVTRRNINHIRAVDQFLGSMRHRKK